MRNGLYIEEQDDQLRQECARRDQTLRREDVLALICATLFCDDSPLYDLIDDEFEQPSERRRQPRIPPATADRVSRGITQHIMAVRDAHDTMVAMGRDA